MNAVRYDAEQARISNAVADALDSGEIPWRVHHLPRRAGRGTVYAGVNPILLQVAACRLGCTSPFWGTAADWLSVGCKVLEPDRPAYVVCADAPALEAVFSWEQTDRAFTLPALTYDAPADVLDTIISRAGVKVQYHFKAECVYAGSQDTIRMPHKLLFMLGPGGETGFLDALSHEVMHWSESRVGWQSSYEINELRAEVGSGLLLAALGVEPLSLHLARHHRRFAPDWSVLLWSRPSLLLRVCENVAGTLDWLLGFAGKSVPWEGSSHPPAVFTLPGMS